MQITSVKTKIAGALAVLASVIALAIPLLDQDPKTVPAWDVHLPVIVAGLGLSITRENKVTSEQAGAKRPDGSALPRDAGKVSREALGIMYFIFAVLLAVSAVMCSACVDPAAGQQAAREVQRHEKLVTWFEAGAVPWRSGETVEMIPATGGVALGFFRVSLDAWRAQAYYLGTGPRPAAVK